MATLHELQKRLVEAGRAGDEERQELISADMRQHPTFQKQSQRKLDKGFTALSGDEKKAQVAKHTARALGIKESEFDAEKGMSGWGRAKIGMLRDEESKMQQLEKTYGRENLNAVSIAGKQHLLYRDEAETGNKWRRVDEQGFSLADVADFSGAAAPIAGAVVGAVKGAAIGSVAGPVGTFAGAVGGAALGGFGAGVAQDVASEVATGQDVDVGDIAAQRGKEALVGAVADTAMLGAGRFVAKPLMKAVGKTEGAQKIMDSFSRLNKKGAGLVETPQISKGKDAMESAGRRAGETGGKLTNTMQSNIDQIDRMQKVATGELPPISKSEAIENLQNKYRNAYAADSEIVSGADKQVREIYRAKQGAKSGKLQAAMEAEEAGIRLPQSFDPDVAAGKARGFLSKQRDTINKESRVRFEEGLGAMDDISIQASTLQSKLGGSVNKLAGIMDEGDIIAPLSGSQATALGRGVTALDDMVERGATIPFRELHNLKKALDGKAGWGSSAPSDNQLIARAAAGKVRKLLEQTADNFGVKGKAYRDANQYFQDNILPFRDKSIAPLLESDVSVGKFKMTPQEVANRIVKDPTRVKDMLDNAGKLKGRLKKELGDIYLDSVSRKLSEINTGRGIAKVLFEPDRIAAIKRLQGMQKRLDVPDSKIDAMAVDDVVNRLTGQARKDAEKALKSKIEAEARISRLVKENAIIQKIANGKLPLPSDPRSFASEIMKHNNADDLGKFMNRLKVEDPVAYQDVRQGITAEFKDAIKFGSEGAQMTSLEAGQVSLWKPGDIAKEFAGRKGARYEQAMGKDWVQNWRDLDEALRGSAITGTKITEQVRAVFTTGSGLLIVAAGVPKWVYGRAMNALSGSSLLRPFIRNVETDPTIMQNLIPYLVGTSEGLRALSLEAEDDPEFAEWLDGYIQDQTQPQPQPAQ